MAFYKMSNEKKLQNFYSDIDLSTDNGVDRYLENLRQIDNDIYDMEEVEKNKLLIRIYENSLEFYNDKLLFKSILVLSFHCRSQNLLNFLVKIYEGCVKCHWALPLGLSYVNWNDLNEKDLSEAKSLARNLIKSSDPKVIEELQFFEEEFRELLS